MRAIFFVLSAALVVGVAFWAYDMNYRTQSAMKRVKSLQTEIARERETTTMLKAEWAWLSRPERLAALVRQHRDELQLIPLAPEHFADTILIAYPGPQAAAPVEEETYDAPVGLRVTHVPNGFDTPRPRPYHRPVGG